MSLGDPFIFRFFYARHLRIICNPNENSKPRRNCIGLFSFVLNVLVHVCTPTTNVSVNVLIKSKANSEITCRQYFPSIACCWMASYVKHRLVVYGDVIANSTSPECRIAPTLDHELISISFFDRRKGFEP